VFSALNQRWYVLAEESTSGAANRIYLAVSASGDCPRTVESGHAAAAGAADHEHEAGGRCDVART
jgi:hypothetical protein